MLSFKSPFNNSSDSELGRLAGGLMRFSGASWRVESGQRQTAGKETSNPVTAQQVLLHKIPVRTAPKVSRGGFTLIEMMVALAVFGLLLAIIFVPLNLGINTFHIGRARAEVQQASQLTLNQIERELRQAVFVYPNDEMRGITDQPPYMDNHDPVDPTSPGLPYYQVKAAVGTETTDVCTSGGSQVNPARNPSRIDLLLPQTRGGVVRTPVSPGYYIVTYYARRLDETRPYDAIDNPIVLFRAQMPYLRDTTDTTAGQDFMAGSYLNIRARDNPVGFKRYYPPAALSTICTSNSNQNNQELRWLSQNKYGEPNLEPLSSGAAFGPASQSASHTLVTPRGMGLIAPYAANASSTNRFVPATTFTCQDISGDGKIDRVTMDMQLAQFDDAGAGTRNGQPTAQRVHLTQSVDLPNVR